MAILSDFFVASPDALTDRGLLEEGPDGRFPTVQAKSFEPVLLSVLQQILAGRDPNDTKRVVDDVDLYTFIAEGSDDGPWIVELPAELSKALAEATPARLRDLAETWARAEEFHGHATAVDLTPLLLEIAELTRQAKADGTGMYLWICL